MGCSWRVASSLDAMVELLLAERTLTCFDLTAQSSLECSQLVTSTDCFSFAGPWPSCPSSTEFQEVDLWVANTSRIQHYVGRECVW